MARLSIGQAEQALAAMQGLSENQRRAYQAEIDAARAKATKAGTDEVQRITSGVSAERLDLLNELCRVRDELAAAKARPERGGIADLNRQRQTLMTRVEEIERLTETVEAIESDPLAYGETLYEKYPLNRPNFTFA